MVEGPELAEYTSPEIQRTSLDELVLQILLLDLGEPAAFLARAVDPPLQAALKNSLEFLEALGAVELSGSDGGSGIATAGDDGGGGTGSAKQGKAKEKKEKDRPIARAESWALEGGSGAGDGGSASSGFRSAALTALGFHLASLPVEPRIGKMLLVGARSAAHARRSLSQPRCQAARRSSARSTSASSPTRRASSSLSVTRTCSPRAAASTSGASSSAREAASAPSVRGASKTLSRETRCR